MNETKDFVIENSVLKQYTGPGSNVVIPDGVTAIGGNSCDDGAFYKRKDITSVIIPDSVTNICELAFYDCYNLTSIFIPDSVVSIGDNAFQKRKNCKWKSVPVDDRELNNFAVKKGNRILSAYKHRPTEKAIGIITKWDKSGHNNPTLRKMPTKRKTGSYPQTDKILFPF